MTVRRDTRVHTWLLATLCLAVLGILYASRILVAATVLPLTLAVYGQVSLIRSDATVRLHRRIEPSTASLGERVEVSLIVENTGSAALVDVRVVDAIPTDLPIVDGDPRGTFSLRAGESGLVEYTAIAHRDDLTFGAPHLRVRSLGAGQLLTTRVEAGGDEQLSLIPPGQERLGQATQASNAGAAGTDPGGGGLEFFSTREYRHGDPPARINWRQLAKTGELTTIDFVEERSVRTAIIVDVRGPGRIPGPAGQPPPAARCAYAAERLYRLLMQASVVTDLGALGLAAGGSTLPTGQDGLPWVAGGDPPDRADLLFEAIRGATSSDLGTTPPSAGVDQQQAVAADGVGGTAQGRTGPSGRGPTNTDPAKPRGPVDSALDGVAPDIESLLANLSKPTEVVLFTPLLDEHGFEVARSLRSEGYAVTTIAPAIPDPDSLGWSLEELERGVRRGRLAQAGVEVVPWPVRESFDEVLAKVRPELGGGHDG